MKRNTKKRLQRRTRKRHRHLADSSRSKAGKNKKSAIIDRKIEAGLKEKRAIKKQYRRKS